MNETWHIPRASLAGSSASSSSNSSNKSYSVPSTVTRHSRHHLHHQQQQQHQEGHLNLAYIEDNERIHNHNIRHQKNNGKNLNHSSTNNNCEIFSISSKSSGNKLLLSRNLNKNHSHINNKIDNGSSSSDDDKNNGLKRGSRSSQGSTDSNSSTHSASSGSLLLTAANLERFAAIHKKQQKLNEIAENRQNYNANITISQQQQHQQDELKSQQTTTTNDTCIEIDPNLHFVKTKDVDAVSIASSTHFTMVNGVGGPPRKIKEGLCSRGHQVTVLIVSMSFFFLIGISAMVYLLEMRAREMPMN